MHDSVAVSDRADSLSQARGIGEVIAATARAHSDRPAIWARGARLTYRELFEYAGRMAKALRSAGIAPGDRVAILANRSVSAYAGIIAVLLAGGTYTPLNNRFPRERNQSILRASGARAVILDDESCTRQDQVLGEISKDVLAITPESDRSPLKVGGRRIAASELPVAVLEDLEAEQVGDLDTPAYLLFTSGTTGAPKGVPISHYNLLSYLQSIQQIAPVTESDRLLQAADLTFDLSVHDMFQSWTRGAELCVVPDNAAILIPRLIAQLEATAMLIVPSVAARAAREGLLKPGGMPSLRYSLFLGEALPAATAESWQAAAPNSTVINTYGPTEATILISSYRLDPGKRPDMAVVPIGWPIGQEQMRVFDTDGRPLLEGETGEVYLAGSQLTRGYWRAPELDAEKFVTVDGIRWYKTGDVGSYSEEHGILFKGRADRQIKIRGYRVELQEIEGAIRRHVGHDQVAVVPWPLRPGGAADGCVGFVVGQAADAREIISACNQVLPFYATPDRILYVDELPLNSNGKVDYKVLGQDPRLSES